MSKLNPCRSEEFKPDSLEGVETVNVERVKDSSRVEAVKPKC